MKKKDFFPVACIVLIFVAAVSASAVCGYRMFSNSGESAVTAMNAEELAAFARLAAIHGNMSREEVYRMLGEPSEDLVFLAKWDGFGGSVLSQARVQFAGAHPFKVRWMKLGFFFYEKRL